MDLSVEKVGKPNAHRGYPMISRNASAQHSASLRRPLATSESKICVRMSTNFCNADKFCDREDFWDSLSKTGCKTVQCLQFVCRPTQIYDEAVIRNRESKVSNDKSRAHRCSVRKSRSLQGGSREDNRSFF